MLPFVLIPCNKECPSLFSILHCLLKTTKLLLNVFFVYFCYLKSILNDDTFKEHINPVIFINLKLYAIIEKVYLFMVPASPGKSQNLKRVLESPGKFRNFAEILEKS